MEKGFTMIELLAVVVIIGILTATGMAIYSRYLTSARASEALQMLEAVISYCTSYNRAHGTWPPEECHTDNVAPFEWIDEVVGEDNTYFEYHYDHNELQIRAEGKASPFSQSDVLIFNLATQQWSATGHLLDVIPE
jgi:prepilin-type N-terminal cleavage/methylation domain-containing protein